MSQVCPRCERILDLPAPAAFCPFCGQSLMPTTDGLGSEAVTVAGPDFRYVPPVAPIRPAFGAEQAMPTQLGDYRLIRKLGQGGMGVVFEGEHVHTGRRVAVKLVDVQASDDALQRFRQEGKLASAVSHPRCVFVYAADQDQGRPYIVLELMPGKTLDDIVREEGPLRVVDAVACTLDLIEGLQQVHALGVIHRDIKPSNCFVDGDNRVKVGDFGLARSLAPDAKLTRTGTFVGTPLFASPEQIKGQPLDARADVYSVCATLYFLLTGRAPHDAGDDDSLAVLARVVSDEAPLVRKRRPDLPAGLERVLARGLARERERRYGDLAALEQELMAFRHRLPALRLVGSRVLAHCLDYGLMMPLMWAVIWMFGTNPFLEPPGVLSQLVYMPIILLYFALSEGMAGATPGKWFLGLRVWGAGDIGPPGFARGLARTFLWMCLGTFPSFLLQVFAPMDSQELLVAMAFSQMGLGFLGVVAMVSTMRASNGYSCLHDLLSRTRVVVAPEKEATVRFTARSARTEVIASGEPRAVGPFQVQGIVRQIGDECILRGIDPTLERAVWIWQRPIDAPAISAKRREAFRGTRPRWLAHGEDATTRWDAFLIPAGAPLTEAIAQRGKLTWEEARPLLAELAVELITSYQAEMKSSFDDRERSGPLSDRHAITAAEAGIQTDRSAEPIPTDEEADRPARRTSQAAFAMSQVWASPEGKIVLIDLPISDDATATGPDLLADAALLLLEGKPAKPERTNPPRALMPGHARYLLEGLPRFGGALSTPAFHRELVDTVDKPTQVSRPARILHLAILPAIQVLCCCVWVWPILMVDSLVVQGRDYEMRRAQEMVAFHDANAAALAVPTLSPLTRLSSAGVVQDLGFHRSGLIHGVENWQGYREARHRRASIFLRKFLEDSERQQKVLWTPYRHAPISWTAAVTVKDLRKTPATLVAVPYLIAILFTPLYFCLFAVLMFRRGARSMAMNIDIVRTDGQRAGRLRCMWRVLMAWIPALGFLAAARYVEEMYWSQWTPGGPVWMLHLADVLWILAIAVPVLCLVLILLTPARSLHDRLSGTCLMPA